MVVVVGGRVVVVAAGAAGGAVVETETTETAVGAADGGGAEGPAGSEPHPAATASRTDRIVARNAGRMNITGFTGDAKPTKRRVAFPDR